MVVDRGLTVATVGCRMGIEWASNGRRIDCPNAVSGVWHTGFNGHLVALLPDARSCRRDREDRGGGRGVVSADQVYVDAGRRRVWR